ncbi:MAG: CapA family protein [Lachnospiraceae bacterium]|nr:CapA family protein [Lachnospiraceae bacterium]
MRKYNHTWMLAVVLAAGLLAGCQSQDYERIELETSADIHLEDTGVSVEDSGILIEQEMTTAADQEPETQPAEPMEPTAPPTAPQPVELLFGGDVLLSSHVLNAYEKAGGIAGVLDEGYRQAIGGADFFMVNEEFPFSDRGVQAADKEYTFRLPTEKVSMFQEMGIDGASLANNHALDFGEDALLDSCTTLDGAGILHTGAGANLEAASQPIQIEKQGSRIAILGATRVIPEAGWAAGKNHAGMLAAYDATHLLAKIKALRQTEDYVVVFVHWGIERDEQPQDYQRTLGQQCIDAGADLVIGSHPHVLQGIEYYKGKPIVYSLGNFVFGSTIPKTMLLQVTLDQGTAALRVVPGTSGAGYTRTLTDAVKLQEFYQYLASISFDVHYESDGRVVPAQAQP